MLRAYIETMGMKNLNKVLKAALWMYMIDFLHKPIILREEIKSADILTELQRVTILEQVLK